MEIKIIIPLIAATVNIVLGLLMYLRRGTSAANYTFIFLTWVIALWSLAIALFYLETGVSSSPALAKFIYFSGGLVAPVFFYFTVVFMGNIRLYWVNISILLTTVGLFYLYFFTNLIVSSVFIQDGVKGFLYGPLRVLFDIHFIVFFLGGFVVLYRGSLKTKDRVLQKQILYILIGSVLGFTLASFSNITFPWLSMFQYIWIGPALVLAWPISIAYAILKHNLFNIRVIVAEFSLTFLWILVFVKILLSATLLGQILSAALLVAVSVLGLFLIRGLHEEIALRTEKEETMQKIARANEELLTLGEKKEEFISIASHQLRTPLTSIKGYASLLLEGSFGELPRMARIGVKKIFRANELLLGDVEDFLLASRIEQGRVQYQFATVELEALLNELLHQMEPIAKEKWLNLRMETEGRGTHLIKADAEKLKQALENIVLNAIEHTKEGLVKIRLTRNEESGKLIIAISDTGSGISAKALRKLFKKFQSADDWFSTGVGLYVSKGIIEAHGGEIWAKSNGKNQGTTFFIQFDEIKDNTRNI